MKRVSRILYIIRNVLFVFHLLFIFLLLNEILGIGLFGYMFLFFEIVLIVNIIRELLSKNSRYQNDIPYNIMQVGLYIYISIIWYRVYVLNTLIVGEMWEYLRNNLIIFSVLIIFLIVYSLIIRKEKNKTF